jgi:hypothetical protein
MKSYKELEEEFEKKVDDLQDQCQHEKTTWMDRWVSIGHYAGYQVKVCYNCNKELEQKPTEEERKAEMQKWLDERKHQFDNILKRKR